MRPQFRATLAMLAAILTVATAPATATYQKIVWQEIRLGSRQAAKQITYTGATMISKEEIGYDALVDGQARTVIYRFEVALKRITVTIKGGTSPLVYQALAKNESLKEMTFALALSNGGRVIATATHNAREAGSGSATGLRYAKTEPVDPFSMDVLLHLPTEFAGTRPQDLFNQQIEEQHAAGAATVIKTLLGVLSGGLKYQRDCETTTSGPSYSCTAACVAPADGSPGVACACSFCGPICCGGSCTVTEGTTTRNCSATVEVGPQE
jgi:hypothetical protein